MLFEQYVLPVFCVLSIIGVLVYGLHADKRERLIAVRVQALLEARAALLSLADVARRQCDETRKMSRGIVQQRLLAQQTDRAYYYDRAAMIVGSIPMDRL